MDVIIIGAGKVGYTLAKFLSKEEDNITVIDNNIDALNSIIEKLDIMGIKIPCQLSPAGLIRIFTCKGLPALSAELHLSLVPEEVHL